MQGLQKLILVTNGLPIVKLPNGGTSCTCSIVPSCLKLVFANLDAFPKHLSTMLQIFAMKIRLSYSKTLRRTLVKNIETFIVWSLPKRGIYKK